MKTIKIDEFGKQIGSDNPVYIIAEGGLTHWGNIDLAKKQVDVAMAAGADAIKFQAQSTEELVSRKASEYWYKRLKYKELSYTDLVELRDYCRIRNIDFLVTAHTAKDLEFVDKTLDVPLFKVGSGESLNNAFLEEIGSRKKPVILSFGLHIQEDEILKSVEVLEKAGCSRLVILHCNTVYPTPVDIVNLHMIYKLQDQFDYPVGYSDHTIGWHIPLAAVALGARVIEKHISFDKSDKRSLDCAVSCEPEELKLMIDQIREIEASMQCDFDKRNRLLAEARNWARQSIVAARNLKKGHVLTKEDIVFKRPGTGMPPDAAGQLIGRLLTADIEQDELLLLDHLNQK